MDEAFDQFDTHETKLNVDSCNSPSSEFLQRNVW